MPENKKPLYLPWNEDEFQADLNVRVMTPVQKWIYKSLLLSAFFHSTRPFLPNDDNLLWILAGCESKNQWLENKDVVLQKFSINESNQNLLQNNRLLKDWEKLMGIRERMSELAQKSAEVRRTFNGRSANPALLTCNTSFAQAEQDKISEDKEREGKISKETVTSEQVSSKGDWANIKNLHRRLVGIKPNKFYHEKVYLNACKEYTEEIVLACFEEWASNGGAEWAKDKNNSAALGAFFKQLPEQVNEVIADREEAKRIAEQEKQAEERQKKEQEIVEANVAEQAKADFERMNSEPTPEPGASALEYLKEIE